jgi:hypothetical protein
MESTELNKEQKAEKLGSLTDQFSRVALNIGKIIIREMHLPNSQRTIPSTQKLGGIAGNLVLYIFQY